MRYEGLIRKLDTLYADPIQYYLHMNNHALNLNQLIGKTIRITHHHNECLACGQNKEIYQMGHCKACYFSSPATAPSIVNPELSTAHLGIAERDLVFEQQMQLQPHIVYLADSGGLKVGVTRATQIPTRWIDQGASQALPIAQTPNRYEAGVIEKELKNHLSDRTDYRKMLMGSSKPVDLSAEKEQTYKWFPADSKKYFMEENAITTLTYPLEHIPGKIQTKTLKNEPVISGTVQGIRGQYMILNGGNAINVRSHEGYYLYLDVL